jgi:uncharacterized membrane protein YiaA
MIERYNPIIVPNSPFWERYFIGVAALIVAALLLLLPQHLTFPKPRLSLYSALLVAVLGIALLVRAWDLEDHPYGVWIDEAGMGLETARMLEFPEYRPIWVDGVHIAGVQMFTYMAGAALWGQNEILSIRLLSVLWGVLSVLAAYGVGKELRGPGFGILMALTLALMRWSINFSRIAMTGVDNHFFTLLTIYCALRMVKYSSLRASFALGLTIGISLWFYASYRIVVPITLLVVALQWPYWRQWRYSLANWGLVLVTAFVVIAPLGVFARENPDLFSLRTRNTGVFFERNREPDESPLDVININIPRYVMMFFFEGDSNGRHNLPNRGMLDLVTAILFLVGLWMALQRAELRTSGYFLLILMGSLITGIVTVKSDTPHANRVGGAVVTVAFCVALALDTLGRGLLAWKIHPRAVYSLGIIVFALMGYFNLETYFIQQRYDYRTWASFSTAESILGYHIKERLAEGATVALSNQAPFMGGSGVVGFIAPETPRLPQLDLRQDIPLRLPPQRDVSLVLWPNESWALDYLGLWYPNMQTETSYLDAPNLRNYIGEPELLYYFLHIPASDLQARQGLDANGAGYLYSPTYGEYQFSAEVQINGQVVPANQPITLYQGLVRFQSVNLNNLAWITPEQPNFQPIPTELFWQAPQRLLRGLLADYQYVGDSPSAAPQQWQRLDLNPNYIFIPALLEKPYRVVWSGYLEMPLSGDYLIQVRSSGPLEVYFKDQLILGNIPTTNWHSTVINTQAGLYPFELRYEDNQGEGYIDLYWQLPGEVTQAPIPTTALFPFVQ